MKRTEKGTGTGGKPNNAGRRFSSKVLLVVFLVFVVLLIVRLLIPPVGVWYANKRLREIPGFTGHVKDIDLRLLRGWYTVGGVGVYMLDTTKTEPVLQAHGISFHLLWSALVHRKIVGEAFLSHPKVSIFERMLKPKEKAPAGQKPIPKPPVNVVFKKLVPINIDEFALQDGEIHFKNYLKEPVFDLYIKDVNIQVHNLTNRKKGAAANYADLDLTGLAMGSGRVTMHATMNPLHAPPNFYVSFKMIGLDVKTMNEFTRAYAGFDFEKGTFDMVTEITAENGKVTGYVKPLFKDLQVFSWSEDVKKKRENIAKAFWQGIVGAIGEIFENQPKNQLATRIPISGTITDPKISVGEAMVNVLRNAFVKAFLPNLEHSVKPPKG